MRYSEELLNPDYRFAVVPKRPDETCPTCGNFPTWTGNKQFPRLWLFTSRHSAAMFRQTQECQQCQNQRGQC